MRILVFGDVHGNLVSLEKLFDIERGNFDIFVCHGDTVNYGPWSNECLIFLQGREDGVVLRGNHEENYIAGFYNGHNEVAQAFYSFCRPRFNEGLLPFINGLKAQVVLDDYTFRHEIGGKYIFLDTDISDLVFTDRTVIGHSHQQFHRVKNGANLYNTGSLGQNRSHINLAEYLIIDTVANRVDCKSFVFDIDIVINEMHRLGYPEICINYYRSKRRL